MPDPCYVWMSLCPGIAGVTRIRSTHKPLVSWSFLCQVVLGLHGWSSWGMPHHVARVSIVTHANMHVCPSLSRLGLSRQGGWVCVTADTTLQPSHELGVE